MNGLAAVAILALAATALFLLAPGLDLWASGLFWRPGDGFFLGDWGPVRLLYAGVPYLTAAVLLLAATALVSLVWRRRPLLRLDRNAIIFLVATLALGPGLAANTLLKDQWGRARPSQIEEFGGTKHFTPAPLPAAECARNCSFVAGHAAMGFYLVAFALLVRERRRRALAIAGALAAGTALGLARVAQGGHFLSDVVFAGLVVSAIAWALHRWIVERDGLGRLWSFLHRMFPAQSPLPSGERVRERGNEDSVHPVPSPCPVPAGERGKIIGTYGFVLLSLAALAAIVVSILWVDRPVALWFKAHDAVFGPTFRIVTQFGVSTGYLIGSALLVLGLRLAARMPRFASSREKLRAWSWIPAFVFTAIAASGLVVDLLKAVFGRARPKLLFSRSDYYFGWWGGQADYWSFPSGHTATIVALATALSFLWPRWTLLYALVAALVALSRIVVTAHYVSDVIFASWIAIAVTWYVRRVFERSGIRLEDALAGCVAPPPRLSWRERLGLRRLVSGNP